MTDKQQTKKKEGENYILDYTLPIHGRGRIYPPPKDNVFGFSLPKLPSTNLTRNRATGKLCPHVQIEPYNPTTQTITLRIDDEAHPEFWCEIDIKPQDLWNVLPASKRQCCRHQQAKEEIETPEVAPVSTTTTKEEDDLTLQNWRLAIPMLLKDDWKQLSEFLNKMKDPKDRLALLESKDDDGHQLVWWALKYLAFSCYNELTMLQEKMVSWSLSKEVLG